MIKTLTQKKNAFKGKDKENNRKTHVISFSNAVETLHLRFKKKKRRRREGRGEETESYCMDRKRTHSFFFHFYIENREIMKSTSIR